MNNWLQQIQSLITKQSGAEQGGEGLNRMLKPAALGGLAGLLVTNKSSRKLLTKFGGSALAVGGGAAAGVWLWNKYRDRVMATHRDQPGYGEVQSPPEQQVQRPVTALVFAAKSDGHIDQQERAAIEQHLREQGYGAEGEALIRQAMDRPLDPAWLAQDVKNEEEALQLWFLSCAVIDVDHFMERSYLSALGDALKIPQDVRDEITKQIAEEKNALTTA